MAKEKEEWYELSEEELALNAEQDQLKREAIPASLLKNADEIVSNAISNMGRNMLESMRPKTDGSFLNPWGK